MPAPGRPEPLWGGLWSTFAQSAALWLANRGWDADRIYNQLVREYFSGPRRDTENLSKRALQQLADQATRVRGIIDDWQDGNLGSRIPRTNIPRSRVPLPAAYQVTANVAIELADGTVVWRPVRLDFSSNPTLTQVRDAAQAIAIATYTAGAASPLPFAQNQSFTVTQVDIVSIFRRT